MIRTRLIAAALVLCLCPFAGAADTGIRTAVALRPARECAAPVSVAMLAQAYYGEPAAALTDTVAQVLEACEISATIRTRYVVILFAGKPTPGGNVTVIHLLFDAARHAVTPRFTLLGVDVAAWIFLSDDKSDAAIVQLTSVPVQNPILGQLGKLASTIVPKFGAAAAPAQQRHAIYVSASPSTPLPLKRAVITESDFIAQGKTQIDGSATFTNQPRTWLTATAGAGVFAGKTVGADQAKIDNKAYVSDPPARAATFAGISVHWPFDGSRPIPSRAERWGLVVAAVLTPSVGLYVGPAYGWRGLALTAGWAEMWVDVPPPPKHINDPVEDHERLATDRSGRLLVSVSYAFGG